ncbi:hypothetical protein BSKO_10306 [Bryopsis sp. KO-2023]|nr:hypothetical protein BSKO_10306 [Bryopsis sp. KO-2023]
MERIKSDVAELRRLLSKPEKTALRSITFDEGTVDVQVATASKTLRVNVVLVAPEAYPASPALLMCEDVEANQKLASVATDFEDSAPVRKVVARILEVFGLDPILVEEAPEVGENGFAGSDVEFYSDEDAMEEGSDVFDEDDGGGSDIDFDDDDEEDKEWTVELGKRQGAWERLEEKKGSTADEEGQGRSVSEKVAQDRQIFDTKTPFKMLSRELLDILREQLFDLVVDAVDDDVYRWSVELAGFDPESGLNQDIAELRKRFSYSSVHLHMTFKRGLHPFFPPRIDVLRPRFKGAMAWALASHPMLQLSNWDPWMRQKELILHLKEFLSKHARIDLDSPMNAIIDYPEAAYSPAERQLARLEALCELLPRCISNPQHKALYECRDVVVDKDRIAALQQDDPRKKKSSGEGKGKGPWAAGTGFGHGCMEGEKESETWDAKKSEMAQRARDVEMERLLNDLGTSLARELAGPEENGEASTSGNCNEEEVRRGLVRTLDGSCLLPFLWREIGNASFTDMSGGRAGFYLSVMKVIKELARPCSSSILFLTLDVGPSSVYAAVSALKAQAQYYSRVMASNPQSEEDGAGESDSNKQESSCNQITLGKENGGVVVASQKDTAVEREMKMGLDLANMIVDVVELLDASRKGGVENGGGSSGEVNGQNTDEYIETMKKYQVELVPNLENGHLFSSQASREASFPKERMVRLGRELAGLQSLLPVNHSSSILVRVDEQKLTLWRALIFGPEDTPYSGGCFLFDIYFPTTYPHSSPKVEIKTTGGGRVRFNPNLYKCGKVCLSLLGTWSGGAGETWDANASTCFQVLVSIQSLILVPQPYFNEPGFEESMHTESGKSASRRYNKDIREHTIHRAMIDYLKNPPQEFREPILSHFRLRKHEIMATCHRWMDESDEGWGNTHASRLKALVIELKGLLDNL